MNKRHYEHTLPNIRGSLSNTYVSIASYISNIIAEHIELNIEEITRMYKDRFSPPKIQ